jgi:RNA polymerase sigma-70 factor (ECF subfamily)
MMLTGVATHALGRGRAATDSLPDAELIALAQQGDVDAYGALVRRYQRDARRVAAAIGGIGCADDAAQEAFVRAYKALKSFRAGAPFRPWLLTIVGNVTRNEYRANKRWTRRAERAAGTHLDVVAPSAEDTALAGHRRRDLQHALDALPARYRDVVVCRYLLDLTEQETASVLAIPTGTVKSRLSRALERLQRSLPSEVRDA